jgi:hypothetical protein
LSKARTLTRRWLTGPLLFCAALLLLFEEWLWEGAAQLLRDLTRLPPFAWCADWIRRRTPYQALSLFVLPLLSLLPLKGVIFVAVMHGRVLLALAVLLLEKLIFTAIFSTLYQLTAPAITQIGWVSRAEHVFLRARSVLHRWLERQALYRNARNSLLRLRNSRSLRRRFAAAYRMQRRRTSRFCFCR